MKVEKEIHYEKDHEQLICSGDWVLSNLPHLQALIEKITFSKSQSLTINGKDIASIDSSGAWLLVAWQKKLDAENIKVTFAAFSKQAQTLIKIIEEKERKPVELPPVHRFKGLAAVGHGTVSQLKEFQEYLAFVGQLSLEGLRMILHSHQWRVSSLATVIYRTGFQGLPIIAILSFLIGVVLTYQMGLQLKNYGANIYIVDLIGLSVLREFGPLITAIMVAGRTGSAFTAQLGMMKLNQEIDALNTMGVTPAELLLIPRIIGLLIALPLLTMWADIFGIIGGMVMSNNMLNISWYDFMERFPRVIPLKTLIIGLGKTPVFALIIATVGCFQGMRVKNSAESVGLNTTKSVVISIFFIIVADAMFSIIFSKLKL